MTENTTPKVVRTRFAPSPTGYIHVGNVRSALYPFFLAKKAQGSGDKNSAFLLRIEDTDQARFVEGSEKLILETLEWLGISWDEGPTLDGGEIGEFGPYHQTARKSIYYEYAQKLVDAGLAYADPTTSEEIQKYREECEKLKLPFLFRNMRPENPPMWTPDCGLPLRLKVTDLKTYHWHDEVFGDLSAGAEVLDDFILIKSDGMPTYNFAHIVDDDQMKITHVIRGAEYISSTPKYLSLYDALGIAWPIFAHLPHILAPDGKKKLGKRDGAKSVTEYRADGYLPEAMVNFLAGLGWNDGT
jgi:glutamyl-tRNA synthetase